MRAGALALAVALAAGACSSGPETAAPTVSASPRASDANPTPAIQDVMAIEYFAGSPSEDLEELRAILDSIRIEP